MSVAAGAAGSRGRGAGTGTIMTSGFFSGGSAAGPSLSSNSSNCNAWEPPLASRFGSSSSLTTSVRLLVNFKSSKAALTNKPP